MEMLVDQEIQQVQTLQVVEAVLVQQVLQKMHLMLVVVLE